MPFSWRLQPLLTGSLFISFNISRRISFAQDIDGYMKNSIVNGISAPPRGCVWDHTIHLCISGQKVNEKCNKVHTLQEYFL